jgi:hypothetical protein
VRFYTNPDGRTARRTALTVIALLGMFYLFPTVLAGLTRVFVPQLLVTGKADAAVLLLPSAAVAGIGGQLLGALVAAGAIAAFLATSSGLLISVAGAASTDLLRGRVRDFRISAVAGGLIPVPLALAASSFELSRGVGLVFVVARTNRSGRGGRIGRRGGVLGGRHAAGRHAMGRRRCAGRLAGDGGGLPGGRHGAVGVRDHGGRQPGHPHGGSPGPVRGVRPDAPARTHGYGHRAGAGE